MAYWRHVAYFGFQTYFSRILGGWRNVVEFLIQAIVLMAILFYMPWFGKVKEESRLVAATMTAFVGTGLFWLLVDLVWSPKRMNDLAAMIIADLRTALRLEQDAEAVKAVMVAKAQEGRNLMLENAPIACVLLWKAEALKLLREHYEINQVYEFENETRFLRPPDTDNERAEWLVMQFENLAMGWSSKAERLQQSFDPQHTPLPSWLEKKDG